MEDNEYLMAIKNSLLKIEAATFGFLGGGAVMGLIWLEEGDITNTGALPVMFGAACGVGLMGLMAVNFNIIMKKYGFGPKIE